MNGTATVGAGEDYTFTDIGVIEFTTEMTEVTIEEGMNLVQYLADCEEEDDETIYLQLDSPTNDAVLGDQSCTQITILDDDRKCCR